MKYLLLIVVLVALILTAGCAQTSPAASKVTPTVTSSECKFAYAEGSFCNGICYFNGSQRCCGGRLYDVNDGHCCGGIMHDLDKEMGTCCGGKWYVYGTKGECCPNKLEFDDPSQNYEAMWIDPTIQHCCGREVVSGAKGIRPGNQWTDCGNSCYDTGKQSCCRSWKQENNETIAVLSVKAGRESCCSDLPFEIPENMTCHPSDGSITSKKTGSGCLPGTGPFSCYEWVKKYNPA